MDLAFEIFAEMALYAYVTRGTSVELSSSSRRALAEAASSWRHWFLNRDSVLDPLIQHADPEAEVSAQLLLGTGLWLAAAGPDPANEFARAWSEFNQSAAELDPSPATAFLARGLCPPAPHLRLAPEQRRGGDRFARFRYFPDLAYLVSDWDDIRATLKFPRANLKGGHQAGGIAALPYGCLRLFSGSSAEGMSLVHPHAMPVWPGTTTRPDLWNDGTPVPGLDFSETVVCGAATLGGSHAAAGMQIHIRAERGLLRAFRSWFFLEDGIVSLTTGVQAPADDVLGFWRTAPGRDRDAWWQVSFGKVRSFDRVRIRFCDEGELLCHLPSGLVFQSSLDGIAWDGFPVRGAVPSAGTKLSEGSSRDYTFRLRKARFLRLRFPGGGLEGVVGLAEVAVLSRSPVSGKVENVAPASAGARAWASNHARGHAPQMANDGVLERHRPEAATPVTNIAILGRRSPIRLSTGKENEETIPPPPPGEHIDLPATQWLHSGRVGYVFLRAATVRLTAVGEDALALQFVHEQRQPLLVEYLPGADVARLRQRAARPPVRILEQDNQAHVIRDDENGIIAGVVFGQTRTPEVAADGPSAFVCRLRGGLLEGATAPDACMTLLMVSAPAVVKVRLNGVPRDLVKANGYVGLLVPAKRPEPLEQP